MLTLILFGFLADRSSYNYDPFSSELVVQKPGSLHLILVGNLNMEINSKLDDIISVCPEHIAEVLRDIIPTCSSDISGFDGRPKSPLTAAQIRCYRKLAKRSPDAAFRHCKSMFPSVVIEISDSNSQKHLGKSACEYISESSGEVSVVIGIKVDDGPRTKRATISVWRPDISLNADGVQVLGVRKTKKAEVSVYLPFNFIRLTHVIVGFP